MPIIFTLFIFEFTLLNGYFLITNNVTKVIKNKYNKNHKFPKVNIPSYPFRSEK